VHATPILRVTDFDASVAYYVNVLGSILDWRDGRWQIVWSQASGGRAPEG
jgi:catechol 2,3-dioxygenase-like lactoylglutathione lyase family enzyme